MGLDDMPEEPSVRVEDPKPVPRCHEPDDAVIGASASEE
jgi:hypothetical protein